MLSTNGAKSNLLRGNDERSSAYWTWIVYESLEYTVWFQMRYHYSFYNVERKVFDDFVLIFIWTILYNMGYLPDLLVRVRPTNSQTLFLATDNSLKSCEINFNLTFKYLLALIQFRISNNVSQLANRISRIDWKSARLRNAC